MIIRTWISRSPVMDEKKYGKGVLGKTKVPRWMGGSVGFGGKGGVDEDARGAG